MHRGVYAEVPGRRSPRKIILFNTFIRMEGIRMTSFTMSVKDKRGGENSHATLDELSWEKLWEALRLYDGNRLRREGKKFYIFSSRIKEPVNPQI
jgi:hypothetical protein